jgi:predicted nucleic acid-binding protein
MQLPDVNVLIYAHREDADDHEAYSSWLKNLAAQEEPFAVSEIVLSGFLRIVTNPKIFKPATPMTTAMERSTHRVAKLRRAPPDRTALGSFHEALPGQPNQGCDG